MRRSTRWLAILLLSACGGEAAPPVPFDPTSAEPQLVTVLEALRVGDGAGALAALDALAAQGPLPEGALHYRALSLEAADRPDEAEQAWRQEVEAHPGNARAQAALARRLMDTGRLDEAAAHLALAERLAPGDVVVRLLAGRLALQRGEDESALRAFRDVLTAEPWGGGAVEAHTGLAQLLARRGGPDVQQAERHASTARHLQQLFSYLTSYRERLRRNPQDAESAYGVATAYLSLYTDYGDARLRDQAEAALQYVLSLTPDDARALYNLGFVRAEQGRLDEALEVSRRAVAADPDLSAARVNLALLCVKQGRTDEAVEQLEHVAAHAQDPKDRVRAHADLAHVMSGTDATREQALAHAQAAIDLDPADPYGMARLMDLLRASLAEPESP